MDIIFYNPIVNLFLLLYKLLFENFVLSIFAVTLILSLILWPLNIRQYRSMKKMREYQDKAKKLQEKRASGKQLTMAEMQEQMQYLKGSIAGCLPVLIQTPFLFCLYDIFHKVSDPKNAGDIFNSVAYSPSLKFPNDYKFHLDFLGLDLSKTIFNIGFSNIWPVVLLVAIIIGAIVAQYFSMRMSSMVNPTKPKLVQQIDATKDGKKNKKTKDKPLGSADEVSSQIEKTTQQTMKIMIVFIGFLSISLPAAASIYFLARSLFVIILTKIQIKYIIKDK